ncbi:MAG: aromatic ring-hydroxylating dioxygenase subunit alpha [Nodosilinea sp.]
MDGLESATVTTLEQSDAGSGQDSPNSQLSPEPKRPLRRLGLNLNHWYVVAQSAELSTEPLAVTLWHQPIVLYRDRAGTPIAVEDRCPHRQVKLSEGAVAGDNLVCAYHGWQFGPDGTCAHVPYLEPQQKRPTCTLRQYPVQERDGFVWIFPGAAALAEQVAPLGVPEWDHLNFIGSVATIDVQAHYSFLIENLMDMYHGHLHGGAQVWANPVLAGLEADDTHVHAHYEAESYYRIDKIWSATQLIIPSLRKLHPEPLDVYYHYPHWRSTLGDDFVIYCLFCPLSETHTRAYLLHFTSLEGFPKLHKTPLAVRRFVKRAFTNSASFVLRRLVREDVLMLEQEQQAFETYPTYRGPELNRALTAVQQLIRQQAG